MAGEHVRQGGMHGRRACVAGRHAWQGGMRGREACMAGGMCAGGHVWQGVCMAGGMDGRGGLHGRRDGQCSGQYASYWNAFLYLKKII